jgi:uncharacterized protein
MKLSRYTLFVDDYPETGKHLAYNTRTKGLVVLNNELRNLLNEMPFPVTTAKEEVQPILNKLEDQGIVMRDEADELDIVRDWFQTIRYNSKKLEAYVLTTYFCNFACPYCFEGKIKEQQKYLTKEKADSIMRWMQHKAMEVNPEEVEIVFYGGEPLMNIPILEYMAEEMHKWFSKTQWKFSFGIITNGALASPELVDRLNQWGLQYVRITVDGAKEFHDQYRPTISGKGTFDLIMRNVKAIIDKTKVVLLGNFNDKSYESLFTFLDYLEAEGLKDKIAMIDFKPITERREAIPADSVATPSYQCDINHTQKMVSIKSELLKRGFKTSKILDGGGICHFKAADHQVIIDTDGMIFKCPAMVGQPSKSAGNVSSLQLSDRYKDFMSFDLVEWKGKCGECKYLPFCAGGCNYHAELQTGDYKNIFCEKDFFDKTIHDFIKLKYVQLIAKKASQISPQPTPV